MALLPPLIATITGDPETFNAAMADVQGTAAETAASIDASTGAIDASLVESGGVADETAGDMSAALAEIQAAADFAALQLDASMASIDASLALAASDTTLASADIAASLDATAGAADTADASFLGLSKGPLLLVGAAIAAVGGVALDLGEKYQTATNTLAANANISVAAANKIGNAFTNQAFTTVYSAQQTMTAYSGVAGQLGSVEGHALTAAQSLVVMKAAQDAAEASGETLTSATSDVATVMQAYGLGVTQAASVSNVLVVAARSTGSSLDTVTSTLQKLKAGLGAAAPPIGQTAGLLVDLANNGETGRKGISAVTTALTTLLKSTEGVATANQDATAIYNQMPPSLQALATAYKNGQITSLQYTTATEGLTGKQAELASEFGTAQNDVVSAQSKLADMGITVDNTSGKFVGMASVIAQLHTKIEGMKQSTALATVANVFGAGAAQKMLSTIEAGPAAYEKDIKAVTKDNAAKEASAKNAATLKERLETLKSGVEDLATKLGLVLVPILTNVVGGLVTLADWVTTTIPKVAKFVEGFLAWSGIDTIVGDVVGFVVQAVGNVVSWLHSHWTTISTDATTAWDVVKNIITVAWNVISTIISVALAVIVPVLEVAWSVISTAAQVAWNVVSTVIGTAITVIIGVVKGVIAIVSFLTGVWQTVTSDVSGFIGGVVSFFEGLPGKIISGLGDVGTMLLNAGGSIIQGLINGITGAVGDAVKAVENAGKSIINAAKSILGIFSPSTVFADMGTNIGAGLIQGIQGQQSAAAAAATALGQAATSAAQTALTVPAMSLSAANSAVAASASGSGSSAGARTYTITYQMPVTGDVSPQTVSLLQKMFQQNNEQLITVLNAA